MNSVDPKNPSNAELVDRVKAILEGKGLTLYQCSQKTRKLYGRPSRYFVPHNLYYDLGIGTFSPSLYQLFALSKISGYKYEDWLRVFGFDPADIVRSQVFLSSRRTSLLDSSLVDAECWIPWVRSKPGNTCIPAIAPIGRLVEWAEPRRIRSIECAGKSNFLYAKIGREDALAFPDLLPGSIVRADTRVTQEMVSSLHRPDSKPLFLIQHSKGLNCCRLQIEGKNRVIPLCGQLPYAQVELHLDEEARVLGILDLEIRSLVKPEQPDVHSELANDWRSGALKRHDTRLSHLLHAARLRMGLSFRDASAMSLQVASELGDEQYFAAPGTLSDYEASDIPPRHAHKAITLCAIYGLYFATLLKSMGLSPEDAGRDPIPDRFVPRGSTAPLRGEVSETATPSDDGFLRHLFRQAGDLPLFLRDSLSRFSGLKNLSLHDFFWVGGELNPLHPLLVNGLLVIVNRYKKKPIYSRAKPLWLQPLYLLLRRNGTYTCGCCSLENGMLVIHPFSPGYQPQEQLRNHDDAEVVGQVVTVAKRL